MTTLTSGHLASNGGIRGHSAGDIFPYIIMAQGTFNNMLWWVINPQGKKVSSWQTAQGAMAAAKLILDGYINK